MSEFLLCRKRAYLHWAKIVRLHRMLISPDVSHKARGQIVFIYLCLTDTLHVEWCLS